MADYPVHEYDVLVVGAGGAGLRAAIESAAAGCKTGVITKSLLGKAHTVMAEGGMAAAMGNVDDRDNWRVHFSDTMRGGQYLNNCRMAELHAKESPARVYELEAWGAIFDRTKDGKILQRNFGGHRYPRLAHVGDRTGLEMIRTLQDHAIHQGIDVYAEHTIVTLLMDGNRCAGAFAYDRERGRFKVAQANQLHEVAMPLGARSQLTFYDEPVTTGSYRPSDPSQVVVSVNAGGAENFQLLLLDRHTGRASRFSDGVHRYESPLWSRSGSLLAYVSNARNGRDFDLYTADPSRPGSERRIAELTGQWTPLDWSSDDRRLLLSEYISAGESYLHACDLATGKLTALTPKRPGPTVAYGGGRWAADGSSVYATSNRQGEFLRLVRLDPRTGAETVLSGDVPWDVEHLDLSSDGALLAFFTNEDGFSRLHLLDTRSAAGTPGDRPLPAPELPPGVAQELHFRRGSHELAFALNWARSPYDVYSYDADGGRLERWTASETGGLDPNGFAVPQLVHYPTFDAASGKGGARRTIPAFVYRPPPGRFPGRRPVYVSIHGGPEAQTRPTFLGSLDYLVDVLGVALIAPNVRGSSGYGKTYLGLDNAEKREDSVKDIGALLDWIATQPDLDAARVMVGGGSYGGYMVLAAMTHYSGRLACGYEAVGISNFVTFLEHTQAYRRDLRRAEYGDERDPKMRAFLESIAPVRHAGDIRKPLLVAAGANDPRVPVTESDQIVAAVETNGVPVWYVLGKNEGHGFQKKANSDYLRTVQTVFLETCLLGAPAAAGAARAPGR